MVVERRLKFAPGEAFGRDGRRVQLPGGVASVTASPLMEVEAVLFEEPSEVAIELAPGEVGRLIQAGHAEPAPLRHAT